MRYKITFLFLLAIVGIATIGQCEADSSEVPVPQPKVDERVELLGIVFRLAGSPEYQCDMFKEYDDAINQHFAQFKWHPAILAARFSRSTAGIGYNAVVDYAIHISIENGHIVFPDENTEKTLDKLESRWNRKAAQTYAKQLDDFYVKSRFHEFFEMHSKMYQKTEEKVKAITDKIDYSWYKRFYGNANLEHFHVILNCTSENCGYGAICRFKDGHDEYFAILGVNGPDVAYREEGFIPFTIHEFNHAFCNPLVEKYFADLKSTAERIWPLVDDQMKAQAYGSPNTMLCEYLVRACEIRYLLAHEMKDEADSRIQAYRTYRGFLWIEELVELLDRYENERDKYPTLDDFMPEIVKMQNALVTDEFVANLQRKEENRPQVTAMSPPNGAKDVDPGITEISVTFDRPMQGGMAWCTFDGGKTFPELSDTKWPVWSEDKRTCTIQNVVLKPGRTYNIWLNSEEELHSNIPGDGFRSTDNIPLRPIHYTFTTKAETE